MAGKWKILPLILGQSNNSLWFQDKFRKKVEAFGKERMSFEVSKMQKINENAEAECQVEFVPKGKLPRIDRPFGNGVLGYKAQYIY